MIFIPVYNYMLSPTVGQRINLGGRRSTRIVLGGADLLWLKGSSVNAMLAVQRA